MGKRTRSDNDELRLSKRARLYKTHSSPLHTVSDEIILRVLSYLSISDLLQIQRVSWRFSQLSCDEELWKEKYYARWVRPRAIRMPRLKDASGSSLNYTSKAARWLNHSHLIHRNDTNWKNQFRLRHNWYHGKCKLRELEVETEDDIGPGALVRIAKGIIFTMDGENGLRAWSSGSPNVLLRTQTVSTSSNPTAIGVDCVDGNTALCIVSIGMSDGSSILYTYDLARKHFSEMYCHKLSHAGAVVAIASALPYFLTISSDYTTSLYDFHEFETAKTNVKLSYPELLSSLRAPGAYLPVTVSLRRSPSGIVACIAYAFANLNVGWSVGLQEIWLTKKGETIDSRTTVSPEYNGLGAGTPARYQSLLARSAVSQPTLAVFQPTMAKPTSLSYSHPYLLATLPDNTLLIYLVNSNAESLRITVGRRLWGHTSAITSAEVSERGKAVSVSAVGDEIRVWELEEVLASRTYERTSIRIQPQKSGLAMLNEAIKRRGDGLGLALESSHPGLARRRSWVGFDDEQVVTWSRQGSKRILSCYDFT